jgi:hypothetical protein
VESVRQHLLDLIEAPSAYDQPRAEIEPLQLEAARTLFTERLEQIPVLKRRAEDAGVKEIRSFDDIIPLLFAHTVYKSYPPSFVEKGQWPRMLQWLNTLSVEDVTKVDVAGVGNVDDWIDRLEAAGHHILATSGTSGKCSFLPHTRGDFPMKVRHWRNTLGWPRVRPNADRPFFSLGPSTGPNSAIEAGRINAELWGRPGQTHFLTDEPLRIADVSAMAAMRRKMGDGSATPGEIAAFETEAAAKGSRMNQAVQEIADKILAHRHEPIVLSGLWAQHLIIIRRARELGIADGDFHPKSVISAGGGVKNVALPEDYKEQVDRFYGNVIRGGGYGMTELAQLMPRCEHNRYHRAPGLITLILDQPGERLLTAADGQDGIVEGRFAFLDLMLEGRWGGLITGDKVMADLGDRCPCGRSGPTILDTITRFAQPGEDDHIGCAGTIDGYIRGALSA